MKFHEWAVTQKMTYDVGNQTADVDEVSEKPLRCSPRKRNQSVLNCRKNGFKEIEH